MSIMEYEEIIHNTPYSMCGFCRSNINSREEARNVDIGSDWDQISCIECAKKHDPEKVSTVERSENVKQLIEMDDEYYEVQRRLTEIRKNKFKKIREVLEEEGYREGLSILYLGKEHIVTGDVPKQDSIYIVLFPVKKDGTPSKIGSVKVRWTEFLRIYRMQRADPEAYLRLYEEHIEKCKERRKNFRLSSDQL